MTTIVLHISDQVLGELRTVMSLRGMTGEAGGIADAVLFKLLMAIEDEEEYVKIRFKTEEENDILSGDVSDSSSGQ